MTLALVFVTFFVCLFAHASATTPVPEPVKLHVMTFNLRYASNNEPNAWPTRRPIMAALLKKQLPDLMGTQEGLEKQLEDIDADLGNDYARIGVAREGENKGEHSAIYYRKDRFDVVRHGDFWLSDTPDKVGSIAWGADLTRLCSWGEFKDKTTGRSFFVFNAHTDHKSAEARDKSAALIREMITKLAGDSSVIVTGDFNAPQDSKPHETLVAGRFLTDTWDVAEKKGDDFASYNDFEAPVPDGPHIDWILVRGKASVQFTAVDSYREKERSPSDHFPVTVNLTLE